MFINEIVVLYIKSKFYSQEFTVFATYKTY